MRLNAKHKRLAALEEKIAPPREVLYYWSPVPRPGPDEELVVTRTGNWLDYEVQPKPKKENQ